MQVYLKYIGHNFYGLCITKGQRKPKGTKTQNDKSDSFLNMKESTGVIVQNILILMDFYWTLMIFRQAALLWLCHIVTGILLFIYYEI